VAWRSAVQWALEEPEVRCLLLRGEGPSFSSGRDTAELGKRPNGETDLVFIRRAQEGRLAILDSPKPVVAAVQGYVLGGAFELALSADMRIAADDAMFALPEIGFGLVADTGGTQLLTMLAGPSKAKYLLLSGDRIDAAQAEQWGLVDWVVPAEQLYTRALALCQRLAAAPAEAATLTKQLVDRAWAAPIRNGMMEEVLAQCSLFAGEEYQRLKAERSARPNGNRSVPVSDVAGQGG
jgi:enoyl-CoA hydratase/carnithine racemase